MKHVCLGPALVFAVVSTPFAGHAADSTIVVPLKVPIQAIAQAINEKLPRKESGARDGVIGKPVTSSHLSWDFNRSEIALAGGENVLRASATISGTARIEGEAQLIRGDVGKILGKLNPTRISFSAHADLGANVSVSATPVLQSNWRLQPNVTASVDVTEARIPVADITSISVRGEIQPKVDEKVGQLIGDLNAKLANDPFIETAAAKAWADLCKAHKINIRGSDKPVWLIVKPTAAHALPVAIDATNVHLTVGITGETRLSDVEFQPACTVLPQLTAPPADEGFALSVPVTVSYDRIGAELTAALKDHKVEVTSTSTTLIPGQVTAQSDNGRVKLTLAFEVQQGGFMEYFFGGTTGKVTALATPVLDAAGQKLSFKDVDLAIDTDDVLNSAALATAGLSPLLEKLVEEKARIDLAKTAKDATDKANAAISGIKEADLGGLKLSEASVSEIALTSIEVAPDALTAIVTAKGKLAVEVRELNFN